MENGYQHYITTIAWVLMSTANQADCVSDYRPDVYQNILIIFNFLKMLRLNKVVKLFSLTFFAGRDQI